MAESIFPFFNDFTIAETTTNFPLYKEIAWDLDNNQPRFEATMPLIVTENEAITTWCYKSLITRRFRYDIYSWDFGTQLEQLIGENYEPKVVKAELERMIEEALLINPYIRDVIVNKVSFTNGLLEADCTIETIYGKTTISI